LGLGGVGSWVAEALARSGVGYLSLLDLDHVAVSNTNRQLPALQSTLGMSKVQVMAERVRDINPDAHIVAHDVWLDCDNLLEYVLPHYDVVIDAIDDSKVKSAVISLCASRQQKILVCGAAGGKKKPELLKVAPLKKVTHDRLLATVRSRMRREYNGVGLDIPCVYSSEQAFVSKKGICHSSGGEALSCAGYGASMMQTASMAMLASAWAIDSLVQSSI
jgi:tRNA A37 threonylcarbamoyladenosine dehydratase